MEPFSSASECIPWLVVLIIECLAIVILNIITIAVFVKKKRQLQRRSTYLIIHLAIVDVLVGAVSGPLQIEIKMEWLCPLWNYRRNTLWSHRTIYVACIHLSSSCFMMYFHIKMAVVVLFLANSLSSEKMQPFSASQCIPWLVVLIIECLATVILNIITIVFFMKKKRQLQRRSLCLIIHLMMVDLLAGAVFGPLQIERRLLQFCPLGNYRQRTSWSFYLSFAFLHLFSFTSLTNLMAISLERLHPNFFSFRHRFVKKWVHRAIVIVIWLIPIVREVAQISLEGIASKVVIDTYLYILFYAVSLFVICVSYILITIKVRCSGHPQFYSRSKRERKLTGTALIVSLVSLLCFLPAIIYLACHRFSFTCSTNIHIDMAVVVLF
ncbi:unnamed protein product [Pocillopora meandrina]|uniref:G-protein coupled receptors family 1 profile domain-containing protein n=1 Tax=Pocillopora meandrina TaxID=46732 RepID=A0AAU9WV48_9CNID|nr:unnamed protein product [Pocillopora meandrina]